MEKNYNTVIGRKTKHGEKDIYTGYVEGWTFAKKDEAGKPTNAIVTKRTVNVQGNEKSVATIRIQSAMSEKQIEYNFGKEFVPEKGNSVFIEVNLWGMVADNITKYNPSLQQILGFAGDIEVKEYEKKDKTKGKKLVMTAYGFKPVTKRKDDLTFNVEESNDVSGADIAPTDETGGIPF